MNKLRIKLEFIIIFLLFGLLSYSIFLNRRYEKIKEVKEIQELYQIVHEQEKLIKGFYTNNNLHILEEDIKHIKETIKKLHQYK